MLIPLCIYFQLMGLITAPPPVETTT
jgi:hypothetical protein